MSMSNANAAPPVLLVRPARSARAKAKKAAAIAAKPADSPFAAIANGKADVEGGIIAVAARRGAKPAQVALAWLLTRPGLTAPIASATDLGQLRELLAAVDIVLDRDDLAALDGASA